MPTEVIMPKVDMVMETGTFVEWLRKEGEHVNKGDPLFVIDTDKAAIEMESPAEGILAGVRAKLNDVIPVTQVIAYILAPGEALPAASIPEQVVTIPAPKVTKTAQVEPILAVAGANGTGKARVTPVARRLAEELHIDLAKIAGRGPRGRIHKADVLAFQKSHLTDECVEAPVMKQTPLTAIPPVVPAPSTPIPSILLPDARRRQVIPLAGARKIIGERMSHSAFTAPHIHLSLRADMTEAIRLRERLLEPLKAQTGQRVSFTAILARAVATVLPRHPYMNASLADGSLILWDDIHLGIATSVEENLIVPVIREAQSKSLGQVVTALADLTDRARNRRLTPSEMTGSTFTISNLGMYGIESFTAIINPPEAAILAVGRMVDTPVKSGDGFEFRPLIHLTACADHRIVDGAGVARFLEELKSTLENPYLLI
ncbi:MAG TPA: dihydrolipoamide acetyltransferase family protein [Anaerolineales bacterium]|nr:dihydrolipoamide acetyltransferase family protein [Anaerolineales bacterium]